MTQPNRLPRGGRVDRGRTLDFTFNGRSYEGFQGDTLASALLANGVRLVGRSFKYHRPRGIVGSGVEEPNALVQLGTGAQSLPKLRRYSGRALRRVGGGERQLLAFGRLRSARRQRRHLALSAAWLLLQDIHVAQVAVAVLRTGAPEGLEGSGSRHRGPTRTGTTRCTPAATFWWSARGRPASPPLWRPGAPERG